jgi:hypothetical protein
MAVLAIKSWVSKDKTQAFIELAQDDHPKIQMGLAAADLDQIINQLGTQRARMIKQPANGSASGTSSDAVVSPKWEIAARHGEGKLLALYHTGFGWLNFLFPDAEAELLAQALKPSPPREPQPPKLTAGRTRPSKKLRSSARK